MLSDVSVVQRSKASRRHQRVKKTDCGLTLSLAVSVRSLTLYGHVKTAQQRTIIQQYGDWYTTLAVDWVG